MLRNAHPVSSIFSHRRKRWLMLLALGALVLFAACGSIPSGSCSTPTPTTGTTPTATSAGTTPTATTAAGSGQMVSITRESSGSFAFSPATLTIKVGSTVTWTNMTPVPHTVTSDDGKSFDSGLSNPIAPSGGTYSFTFKQAGTFS